MEQDDNFRTNSYATISTPQLLKHLYLLSSSAASCVVERVNGN